MPSVGSELGSICVHWSSTVGEGLHLAATLLGGGGMSSSFVDLIGGLGYDFTDQIKAFAGYRYLKVDYQNKDFIYDVEMQGPMISGTYKF